MQRRVSIAALVAVVLLALAGTPQAQAAPATASRYIVTLSTGTSNVAATAARVLDAVGGGTVERTFTDALQGFTVTLSPAAAAALAVVPGVAGIERDGVVTVDGTQSPTPSWGLDRIDQRNRPLTNTYTYPRTGAGVRAYIIDTGIRATHTDFGGRVVAGTNTVDANPSTTDCHGHGTHTAATVGGATYGVAKGVTLVAVRVFACANTTTTSAIIAGVDWAAADHAAGVAAVANMSLGGGASTALDNSVRGLIADGVTVAIAAGNGNQLGMAVNSCTQSPARVTQGITVGATDSNDAKASWSNYGTCVDLHAPGVSIVSAGIASDSASATMSGTSMAAPHVAGAAALYLEANPGALPAAVQTAITNASTKGIVTGTGGGLFGGSTPNNHLLYVGSL